MHTNAFRSLQDKAWKGLPRHKNVSSPPAAGGGEGRGFRPTPSLHPLSPPQSWRSVVLLLDTWWRWEQARAAVATSS